MRTPEPLVLVGTWVARDPQATESKVRRRKVEPSLFNGLLVLIVDTIPSFP